MRKQTITLASETVPRSNENWLDLERLARVEITSESAEQPIESALVPNGGRGWRAAQPGKQMIRLLFDFPISLKRIYLEFDENKQPRTQEFSLRWLPADQQSAQDIVRQQYTFSLGGTNHEIEDYRVDLTGVAVLELEIIPDISGGAAYASLLQLSLA